MIQIIPRVNHVGLYGPGVPQEYSVHSGLGQAAYSDTFGSDYAKHPVSVDGTFRQLVIGSNVLHPTFTVTLLVNGTPTALTATLDAGAARAQDGGATVAVMAGDDVCYRIDGPPQLVPGLSHHSTCVAFEGAACSFGITPNTGALAAGLGWYGGAFGNGVFENFDGGIQPLSNTYSICAVAGTITRLDAKTYAAPVGSGAWVAAVRVNGVTQDGGGGTVDTRCTLTGAATQAVATFTLPVQIQDRVDVLLLRTGTDAPYAIVQVACSLAFVPTEAGAFMLCGGSTDVIEETAPDWKWTRSVQAPATEALAEAPIGPTGLQARGLYVRRRGAPGPGSSTVYTLRRSGTDTAIALTIADLATEGLAIGGEPFAAGEAITIQAAPVNVPVNNGFYWGLAASAVPPTVPPESYTIEEHIIRRLRRAPHLHQEHVRLFYRKFELDLERGVGLASGQGEDPLVLLRLSRDGGHTWSEPLTMSAGRLGVYTQRVIARRLGQARDTVFEVTVSDPVAWSLVQAWLDLEVGTS